MARIEACDLGDGDEQVAPFDFDDESDDGGMRGVPHASDDVLYAAQTFTRLVDQGSLDDVRNMNYLKPHAGRRFFVRHEQTVCPDGWHSPSSRVSPVEQVAGYDDRGQRYGKSDQHGTHGRCPGIRDL
jgi:hypothetical protein